jgi:hypothetical protein
MSETNKAHFSMGLAAIIAIIALAFMILGLLGRGR